MFQVKFEAIVWRGFEGDIAIDDIRIADGSCPHKGSCDFEYDMCGFFNPYSSSTFDWLRNSGETSTSNTGPPVDHTTSTDNGKYSFCVIYSQYLPQAHFSSNFPS